MSEAPRSYWLMKTEPSVFSFDDLWSAKGRATNWDGVRNYQVRNFLRDSVRAKDGVLIYHSSADPTGVAGFAEVVGSAFPDETQFDRTSDGFDPKSSRSAPTWLSIRVRALHRAPKFVTLEMLKSSAELGAMGVLKRGNRLSIQPVTAEEWRAVARLAGLKARS